jgi:hypothetical protein
LVPRLRYLQGEIPQGEEAVLIHKEADEKESGHGPSANPKDYISSVSFGQYVFSLKFLLIMIFYL